VNDSNFSALGLAEPIQRALHARNHVILTPIQARAIPSLLAGKHMLGIAQTGTGKTAAFALPILHQLSAGRGNDRSRGPRAA
jgi:ATP-dependent RNA helicase RhlE